MTIQLASNDLKELMALEREAQRLKDKISRQQRERAEKVMEEMINKKVSQISSSVNITTFN